MAKVNDTFWLNPPWRKPGLQMGLNPVERSHWYCESTSAEKLNNKERLLAQRYVHVMQSLPGSHVAQQRLLDATSLRVTSRYPDALANLALAVDDDLCLLDVADDTRLVAGCVCAPSYWCLADKLGSPLREIHAGVPGLQQKLGQRIAHFLHNMPLQKVFERHNWFVHDDNLLFHPTDEKPLKSTVERWFVRSERQTFYKYAHSHVLFAVDVTCEPLSDIRSFSQAAQDMLERLRDMDEAQIDYFGGLRKHQLLKLWLNRIAVEGKPN